MVAPQSTSRNRVLTDGELKAVWKATELMDGHFGPIVKLLILTGQRRSEIAGLQTSWVQNNTITLPSGGKKHAREHTFPIGPLSASIITLRTRTALLFPARGNDTSPFNGWSKSKATLDALTGIADWILHDLRRTFATRLAEMGVAPHVIERLLNHVTGSLSPIALVYNKAKYLEEMREAMKAWEVHVAGIIA
jgi:integrase